MSLKLSQGDEWTLRFPSYSPAFYVQNKIRPRERLREWRKQVNKLQTQGERPSYMSSRYSKELNVQNVSYDK